MPTRSNSDTRGSGKLSARRERNQRPKLSPTCIKRFCDLPAAQSKWTTSPPSSSSAFKPACYSRKEKRKYRLILIDVSPVAQGFSTFEDRKPFAKSLRALFQRIPRHTFRLLRNLFQAGFQRDLIFQNPRVQKFHHPLHRILVNLSKSLLERRLSPPHCVYSAFTRPLSPPHASSTPPLPLEALPQPHELPLRPWGFPPRHPQRPPHLRFPPPPPPLNPPHNRLPPYPRPFFCAS